MGSENDKLGNEELIVILSIVLTCLSLIISITKVGIVLLRIIIEYNVHVQQTAVIGVKLTVQCDNFKRKHQFSKQIMNKCILTTLRECKNSKLWIDRKDISLKVETFYVNSARMKANQEMDFYFDLTLASYQKNLNEKEKIAISLLKTIKNFKKQNKFESKQFIKVRLTLMHGVSLITLFWLIN